MNKENYIPRIIDDKIEEYLKVFGAVCIETGSPLLVFASVLVLIPNSSTKSIFFIS